MFTTRKTLAPFVILISTLVLPGAAQADPPIQPATIIVNTTADNTMAGDGLCTLREAIANVNAAGETTGGDCVGGTGAGDTIVFDLLLPATIVLTTNTELLIAKDVTIGGLGNDGLLLDGNMSTRVFEISAATVTIEALTIQNGASCPSTGVSCGPGGALLIAANATLTLNRCVMNSNSTGLFANGGAIDNEGGTVTVTDCAFNHNYADGSGGAIENTGPLTLTDCTIDGNSAGDNEVGGAIDNRGSMTLLNCTLINNTLNGAGGAIENRGTMMLTDCTVNNNFANDQPGGAIDNSGSMTLTRCTLNGNSAEDAGGGAVENSGMMTLTNCSLRGNGATAAGGAIESSGTVTLMGCTFAANSTGEDEEDGGAIASDGNLTVSNCTFSHNTTQGGGGGIVNGQNGMTTVDKSTFVGNRAKDGGAIRNDGTMTVTSSTMSGNWAGDCGGVMNTRGIMTFTNCTVSSNSTDGDGGGICAGGTTTLINCTVSLNSTSDSQAGGLLNSGTTTLINTVLAFNSAPDNSGNCFGTRIPIDGGHNVSSDSTCFSAPNINIDPRLAPLGHYGGPTQTMALCTAPGNPDPTCTGASPAIDAGDDAVTGAPLNITTDQRGQPRLSGQHVDIGAYEVQPQDLVPVCVGACTTPRMVDVADLMTMVMISLEELTTASCPAGDVNHDGAITIDEIVTATNNALSGCN